MTSINIPTSMRTPMLYGVACFCCSCGAELSSKETYICKQCNDEIDRQADEVIGNAEEGDE